MYSNWTAKCPCIIGGRLGAVLATSNQIYRMTQKTINAVNKVGFRGCYVSKFCW